MQKPPAKPTKTSYLTNRYLLQQIHQSKLSYCEFLEPEHATYHFIVQDLKEVTVNRVTEELDTVNARMAKDYAATNRKAEMPDHLKVTAARFIVRHSTFEHVPLDPKNTRPKGEGKGRAPVPFPPFKHYLFELQPNGRYKRSEVGRSHWRGGFGNGHFDAERGRISDGLAMSFMLLVERFGRKGNWRGYTWRDEMQANALVQLCHSGLQFDESRSDNPFAFLTTTVNRIFIRTNTLELSHRDYRDEQLIIAGAMPSISAQADQDMKRMGLKAPPPLQGKRGRPPKEA